MNDSSQFCPVFSRSRSKRSSSHWIVAAAAGLLTALLTLPAIAGVDTLIFKSSFETTYGPGELSQAEAARFLDQATYGGRLEDIQHLQAIGIPAWIDEQIATPISLQVPFLDYVSQTEGVYQSARLEAWYIHAAQLPDPASPAHAHSDQLRQRLAFAWSELFVVSDNNAALLYQPWALASYYDMLAQHAFGNYRDLLEAVTLHPAMGRYLSMLGNRKSDAALNIRPDENYAREVLQLFSVGLYQLNLDGSRQLNAGQPIPTYDQNVVRGFAHVFTGWNFAGCTVNDYEGCGPSNPYDPEWISPMAAVEAFHDNTTNKQLLDYPGVQPTNGLLIAGDNAQAELDTALDNIFNHPNVGPFIARHLIQRLITSNPTPGYIQRVASVFNDNGFGVRGDLDAVVRAILLDEEARQGSSLPGTPFGKLREPSTKLVRLFRITDAHSVNGRVFRYGVPDGLDQQPLTAPSVFNFFQPDFAQPGEIRDAGLVSPEFQIHTDTQMVSAPNALDFRICCFFVGSRYGSGAWEDNAPVPSETLMDYGPLMALAADPANLVDHLNLVMLAGSMSNYMRDLLITRLNGTPPDSIPYLPSGTSAADRLAHWRVQQALYLIVTSPEFSVQK